MRLRWHPKYSSESPHSGYCSHTILLRKCASISIPSFAQRSPVFEISGKTSCGRCRPVPKFSPAHFQIVSGSRCMLEECCKYASQTTL